MNVIDMYDYYFFDKPCRKLNKDECRFVLCDKSIVYRRIVADETIRRNVNDYPDILEYMLYNVSGETGLPAHYSCCMDYTGGHVCNAIPIMIGSKLEKQLVRQLCANLDLPFDRLFDDTYLHQVYAATFLINGTFYYSVFRESNNNKICHNTRSKFRGEETVAYYYDMTYNRGIKLYTGRNGHLKVNDRDGKEISNVTKETLAQLYNECLRNPDHYSLNPNEVAGFFSAVKQQGFSGIDSFKNKIYTNYSIGLNNCLDKIHPTAVSHPICNTSLMMGKVNLGISQRLSYPKSKSEVKKQNEQKLKMCTGGLSTGYLVESQRRRNTRKVKQTHDEQQDNLATHSEKHSAPMKTNRDVVSETMFGSNEIKTSGFIEKIENGERNGPSMFNQVTVPYLPFVRLLSSTVQKLQVEHVHAESSKTVPKDAVGFICMKYVGNISTAGKNMLFTDRVHISYGHVHEVITKIEDALTQNAEGMVYATSTITTCNASMRIVINNAVTKYSLINGDLLLDFLVWLKFTVHPFIWIKPVGGYVCVYFFEGVPLLEYVRQDRLYNLLDGLMNTEKGARCLSSAESLCLTRNELELIRHKSYSGKCKGMQYELNGILDKDDSTNMFVIQMSNSKCTNTRTLTDHQRAGTSLLASQLDQYTEFTPPSKRSVSVNARKSACVNVYYQKAADFIRGFNIFTDPDAYERRLAERQLETHGIPTRVTLDQFRLMREDANNCPQPQFNGDVANTDGEKCLQKSSGISSGNTIYGKTCDQYALRNFYMMCTIFADIDGFNVEDANVMDKSVDLCLRFSYSFSLTFLDRTTKGVDVLIPPAKDSVRVCGWTENGDPLAVLFMVCSIRTDGSEPSSRVHFPNGECGQTSDCDDKNSTSNNASVADSGIQFPPFRKMSVIKSKDGSYHVYILRNDAALLRTVKQQRDKLSRTTFVNTNDPFGTIEEINPYEVLDYLQTNVARFTVSSSGERVVTIDFRAHGRVDKYDGIKVVNSFGQKGLALIRDVQPYVKSPVQLVMNVCSFVSRQPVGQFLQMKRNFPRNMNSTAGEPYLAGFSSVFFTETEPTTKTCLVRFDEMMRSVIITIGLTSFQNIKSSLDNVYNPRGLLCPPQARQILNLYRCYGIAYKISGDRYEPYSTREDVNNIFNLFDACKKELDETIIKRKNEKSKCTEKTAKRKHRVKDTTFCDVGERRKLAMGKEEILGETIVERELEKNKVLEKTAKRKPRVIDDTFSNKRKKRKC